MVSGSENCVRPMAMLRRGVSGSTCSPAILAFERLNAAARDAVTYNLERKPFVFGVFSLLAEATRGGTYDAISANAAPRARSRRSTVDGVRSGAGCAMVGRKPHIANGTKLFDAALGERVIRRLVSGSKSAAVACPVSV